jgi:hypothetical protein
MHMGSSLCWRTCDLEDAVELIHGGAARKDGLPRQQLSKYAPCTRPLMVSTSAEIRRMLPPVPSKPMAPLPGGAHIAQQGH